MALSPTSSRGSSGGSSSAPGPDSPLKASVIAVTVAQTSLTGLQTIDGYTLQAGDRVLVNNQTTNTENGIYVAAAGAWSRASDCPTVASMVESMVFSVGALASFNTRRTAWQLWCSYNYPTDNFVEFTPVAGPTIVVMRDFDAAHPERVYGVLESFYLGNANNNGGGFIWAPGGLAYGSAGSRSLAAWEAAEDGTERLGGITAPTDASIQTGQKAKWYDNTTGKPVERFKLRDAAGTLFSGIVESACPITSAALPTTTLSSGTGAQILVSRAVETATPFTGDGTNNAATCAVALSPDNVTYSTLDTLSIAAALNLTGVIALAASVRVPAGWYLRLTASHGTIGTTTYY